MVIKLHLNESLEKTFYIVKENSSRCVYEVVDEINSDLFHAQELADTYKSSDLNNYYYVVEFNEYGNPEGHSPLSFRKENPAFNFNTDWDIVDSVGNIVVHPTEPIFATKHGIWLGYIDEIEDGLEHLHETFPDLEQRLKGAKWLRDGDLIYIPRGTQFTIEVDDVIKNSFEYSVVRVHNGPMAGLPIIFYDEAAQNFKDKDCKLVR